MPVTPPEMNQLERSTSFELRADGTITGKIQEQSKGQPAARERTLFKRLSKSEYNGLIEQWVTRRSKRGAFKQD